MDILYAVISIPVNNNFQVKPDTYRQSLRRAFHLGEIKILSQLWKWQNVKILIPGKCFLLTELNKHINTPKFNCIHKILIQFHFLWSVHFHTDRGRFLCGGEERTGTWYWTPRLWLAFRMLEMLSAALTGTVLFSTTILDWFATSAIILAAASTYFRSAALPYIIVTVLSFTYCFPNAFVLSCLIIN